MERILFEDEQNVPCCNAPGS